LGELQVQRRAGFADAVSSGGDDAIVAQIIVIGAEMLGDEPAIGVADNWIYVAIECFAEEDRIVVGHVARCVAFAQARPAGDNG
jgi:hypothetical protein